MKRSAGFSKLIPSILVFILYPLLLAAFVYALRSLHLSFAYAVWAGAGVLAVGTIGILYLKEPLSAQKIISILLISAGMVTFYLSGATHRT